MVATVNSWFSIHRGLVNAGKAHGQESADRGYPPPDMLGTIARRGPAAAGLRHPRNVSRLFSIARSLEATLSWH